jgi:hypothetical protein
MPAGRSMPQAIALAFGVIYTLFGLAGFLVTGFSNFAGYEGDSLLGFEVNPLHNIAHLVVGVLGITMAKRLSSTRTFGWILFLGFGALFLFGLFAVNRESINFLAINGADNVLHLLTSLVGLAIALWPVQAQVRQAERQMQEMRRR